MAKKHSDNIEDRFREAAENISFPLNEEAWNKMEALLDRDKQRRPVFGWWFVLLFGLLVGAGILSYYYFRSQADSERSSLSAKTNNIKEEVRQGDRAGSVPLKNSKAFSAGTELPTASDSLTSQPENDELHATGPNTGKSEPANSGIRERSSGSPVVNDKGEEVAHIPGGVSTAGNIRRKGSTGPAAASGAGLARQQKSGVVNSSERMKSSVTNARKRSQKDFSTPAQSVTANRKTDGNRTRRSTESPEQTTDEGTGQNNTSSEKTGASSQADNSVKALPSGDSAVIKKNDTSQAKVDSPKLSGSDSSTLNTAAVKITASSKKWQLDKGFNISLGARIDATDLHKISLRQFNQLAGGTVGYRFSNRLSIQTGLFVQKAVYYAGPEDYYVKPGSYLSMYKISKIDAVCQIYEIPLSVRYDLLIGKGLRLYALGGLNSFYLKKEDYRYHATGSSGYRMFDSAYHANKNYFSSAYLGVGLEKKITPVFSVLAEPYAKLPISGVGAGKVKLYSGGVQLMLRYQPQSGRTSSLKK